MEDRGKWRESKCGKQTRRWELMIWSFEPQKAAFSGLSAVMFGHRSLTCKHAECVGSSGSPERKISAKKEVRQPRKGILPWSSVFSAAYWGKGDGLDGLECLLWSVCCFWSVTVTVWRKKKGNQKWKSIPSLGHFYFIFCREVFRIRAGNFQI